MKTLADLYKTQQLKEKRTKYLLIALIAFLSFTLLGLFLLDPWEMAYDKEKENIKERQDEFVQALNYHLNQGEYLDAYYIDYGLDLSDIDYDLYSLLSDSERIIVTIRNIVEGKPEKNYYDLSYLVDSFYNEYFYLKKYGKPSNYIEDIKDEIEDYLFAYNLMSIEELNSIKERNSYE